MDVTRAIQITAPAILAAESCEIDANSKSTYCYAHFSFDCK